MFNNGGNKQVCDWVAKVLRRNYISEDKIQAAIDLIQHDALDWSGPSMLLTNSEVALEDEFNQQRLISKRDLPSTYFKQVVKVLWASIQKLKAPNTGKYNSYSLPLLTARP